MIVQNTHKFLKSAQLLIWAVISSLPVHAQEAAFSQWIDHLPYTTLTDITSTDDGDVWATSTSGILHYNDLSKEVSRISTVNGLSEVGPTCIATAPDGSIWVGYPTGTLDIIQNGRVSTLNDIKEAAQFTGLKRINNFSFTKTHAYAATDFGIVEINLNTRLFGRTFLLGDGSTPLAIRDLTTSEDGTLYAAPISGGILVGEPSENLVLFSNWYDLPQLSGLPITKVVSHLSFLFVVTDSSSSQQLYRLTPTAFQHLYTAPQITSLKSSHGTLTATTPYNVLLFTTSSTPDLNISAAPFLSGTFFPLCAITDAQGTTYIGNKNTGLIRTQNLSGNARILPNSPYSTNTYTLLPYTYQSTTSPGTSTNNSQPNGGVLLCPGALDELWTRTYLSQGIDLYQDQEWTTRSRHSLYQLSDLIDAAFIQHADGTSELFLSSWGSGIAHLSGTGSPLNHDTVALYNTSNTNGVLRGVNGNANDLRTGGLAFDSEGNLWGVQSLVTSPLFKRSPDGTFSSHTLSPGSDADALKQVLITSEDLLFVQSRTKGLFAKRLEDGLNRTLTTGVGSGDLPSNHVLSMAEDLDGELWIGTDEGLNVLYTPGNIFTGNGTQDSKPILFEEDGVVQRLLGKTPVTAICVDGGNRKWLGTRGAGLFLVSPDGIRTVHQFTTNNSPLLSNNITSLAIDPTSGELLIGTDKGLIGYRGDATPGSVNLYPSITVAPNPVRPSYTGPVLISGLPEGAIVKITDVRGQLVYETQSNGGTARWDRTNLNGHPTATGVYIVYASDDLGEITGMSKILLVR